MSSFQLGPEQLHPFCRTLPVAVYLPVKLIVQSLKKTIRSNDVPAGAKGRPGMQIGARHVDAFTDRAKA
ncbi:MAG: hypothetical protein ACREDR_33465, partial [Blastocatellia bacterium]